MIKTSKTELGRSFLNQVAVTDPITPLTLRYFDIKQHIIEKIRPTRHWNALIEFDPGGAGAKREHFWFTVRKRDTSIGKFADNSLSQYQRTRKIGFRQNQ